MRLRKEKQFERDFDVLPERIKRQAATKFAIFVKNPRHPSLKTKKMEGQGDIWEGRISGDYRFTFKIEGDLCKLRRIGTHEIYRRP